MAGLTTSSPLKLLSFNKTTPSSSESKLFGLRIRSPNQNALRHSSLAAIAAPTTSRYGGGGGGPRFSSGGDPRRFRNSEPVEEESLDMSKIRSDSVRLIDDKQNMVGIVSKAEAVRMADDAGLNLVILSLEADPPVVKIMDYNKYRYEQQKKKREQQKKSAASRMDLKELKMGYNIDQHDYSVRMRSAQKFLKDGDKVKVVVNLKGRENEFRKLAIELLKRFQDDVGELATVEAKSFRERNVFVVLVPNKAVQPKAQEPSKKKETSDAVDEVSASL